MGILALSFIRMLISLDAGREAGGDNPPLS